MDNRSSKQIKMSNTMKENWKKRKANGYQNRADKGITREKYNKTIPAKFASYLYRANAKSIPFELTVEDFDTILQQPCHYCNMPSTGIDRKSPKRGYILSNAVPCCAECNWMKGKIGYDAFIDKCCKIASKYYYNNQ